MIRIILFLFTIISLVACTESHHATDAVTRKPVLVTKDHQLIDTSEVTRLKGGYMKGRIIDLIYGHTIDSGRQLVRVVDKDKVLADILFPIANEEVKNFRISKIVETENGFAIHSDWGGGNFFYDHVFQFDYVRDTFFATKVSSGFYQQDSEERKENDSTLTNPVPVGQFNPVPFIINN